MSNGLNGSNHMKKPPVEVLGNIQKELTWFDKQETQQLSSDLQSFVLACFSSSSRLQSPQSLLSSVLSPAAAGGRKGSNNPRVHCLSETELANS